MADFAALCAWLLSSGFMACASFFLFGQDFRGYYAAARLLLAGGNPYDYTKLAPVLLAVTGRMGNNPYYYPPWFAWFFTPYTLLPYTAARIVWMVFNLAVWIFSLCELGQFLNWPLPGWRRSLLFLLLTILFAWMTWRYEQIGIVLFALYVAALISLKNGKWIPAGIWMALLLFKPNVTLLPLIFLSVWLLQRKQWRPVVVMAAVLAGLFLVSTLATPDWYKPLLLPGFGGGLTIELDGPKTIVAVRINSSLIDFLGWLHIVGTLRTSLYALAAVSGVVVLSVAARRSKSLLQIVAIALIVGYAITPYDLQYDFPPLAIVLYWALALIMLIPRKKPRWIALLLTVFLASIPFWERPISEAYLMVLALGGVVWIAVQGAGKIEIPPNLQ